MISEWTAQECDISQMEAEIVGKENKAASFSTLNMLLEVEHVSFHDAKEVLLWDIWEN